VQTGVPLTSKPTEEVPFGFMINARFYVLMVVMTRVQIFGNDMQSLLADLQKFWIIEIVPSSVSRGERRVSALFSVFGTEEFSNERHGLTS
jgi:hypothetical protein